MHKKVFFNIGNLIKGGGILFIGLTFVNICNYIFNMIVGRSLGPDEYGVFVALVSLLSIISVFAGAILTTSAKYSSTFKAENKPEKIGFLLDYLNSNGFIIGILIALVIIIFSKNISDYFNISTRTPLILLSLYFIFTFSLSANRGVLQGIQNFISLSVNSAIEPFSKIIVGIILIWFGFRINGVMLSVSLAVAIAYLFSIKPLNSYFKSKKEEINRKLLWRYSSVTLIALAFLTLLTFLDTILVKHYFNSYDAGTYGALSTICKIILYGATPIISAMFPMISNLQAKDQKHYYLLFQTMFIVTIVSFIVYGFFRLFPDFTINILFGSQYTNMSPYLGQLGLAFLLLSLNYVFVNYYLSVRKYQFIYILIFATILLVALVHINHNSIEAIINALTASYSLALAGFSLIYLFSKRIQIWDVINNNSGLQ